MYIRRILLGAAIVSMLVIAGCSSDRSGGGGASSMMPNITGASGEVMLIMNDKDFENKAGDVLKKYLLEQVPALPQREPMFNLNQINRSEFKKIMQTHRNIIRAAVGDEVDTTAFTVKKDLWAHPQYVIDIKAPTVKGFVKLAEMHGESIQRVFKKAERMRTIASYRKYEDSKIPKILARDHHIYLTVPKSYSIAQNKKNFIWILKEKGQEDFYQSINVYYTDYLDTTDFSKSHLVKMRDKFMKNIEGGEKGTYMKTEPRLPVLYEKVNLNGRYAVRMRGLWRKTGDILMGGPFISYSFVDEQRNRMITIEGWVYAPDYDKRNYLRQLNAILRTVKVQPVNREQPKDAS